MNTIKQVIDLLEELAPPQYQESYDNSGLLTGDSSWLLRNILVTLDCTEAIVDEAIAKGCNLIVAHHPIIFSGIKKLNGKNYVERTVIKAIKNDVAIYAIHTNLDNVLHGVNARICEKIGLVNPRILQPKYGDLKKLAVYVPKAHLEPVQAALFGAGAGNIGNYSDCSFYTEGNGTFKGNENSNAFVGDKNGQHTEAEFRLEVILPSHKLGKVITALLKAHPYEEVAYDIIPLGNENTQVGSGMIGELTMELESSAFLAHLKKSMNLNMIRFTSINKPVKTVAVCGGAGSFLLKQAMATGADAFVSADFKYHEFFDGEGQIMIADIGHYESEIFTINLLADEITKKMPTFAVILSNINTNPINYY